MKLTTTRWNPVGWEEYRTLYPATPSIVCDGTLTQRFLAAWGAPASADDRLRALAPSTTIVLIKGFLGGWMPGNFAGPRRALAALGFDVVVAANHTGDAVEANAGRLGRQLARRGTRDRLIFCGHSKGGLEARWTLAEHPDLAARCAGVIMAQSPRGPSRVLESLLLGAHADSLKGWRRRWAERFQRVGLRLMGARRGGFQLTGDRLQKLVAQVEAAPAPRRILQVASWSSVPTTWLDSFHQRLGEVRPGCAHDGQFYLEDLIWPGVEHVLLPRVDHAQPAMGGHGFDEVQLWKVLLGLLYDAEPAETDLPRIEHGEQHALPDGG